MGKVGIWTLVGLGALLGTALTQWPYGRACGWPLGFYLIAVATLVVTGMWGALASWRGALGGAPFLPPGANPSGPPPPSPRGLPRARRPGNTARGGRAPGRGATHPPAL